MEQKCFRQPVFSTLQNQQCKILVLDQAETGPGRICIYHLYRKIETLKTFNFIIPFWECQKWETYISLLKPWCPHRELYFWILRPWTCVLKTLASKIPTLSLRSCRLNRTRHEHFGGPESQTRFCILIFAPPSPSATFSLREWWTTCVLPMQFSPAGGLPGCYVLGFD